MATSLCRLYRTATRRQSLTPINGWRSSLLKFLAAENEDHNYGLMLTVSYDDTVSYHGVSYD